MRATATSSRPATTAGASTTAADTRWIIVRGARDSGQATPALRRELHGGHSIIHVSQRDTGGLLLRADRGAQFDTYLHANGKETNTKCQRGRYCSRFYSVALILVCAVGKLSFLVNGLIRVISTNR
jgi:hypothetical protein